MDIKSRIELMTNIANFNPSPFLSISASAATHPTFVPSHGYKETNVSNRNWLDRDWFRCCLHRVSHHAVPGVHPYQAGRAPAKYIRRPGDLLLFREWLFLRTHSKRGSSSWWWWCCLSSTMRALPRLLRRCRVCFQRVSCSHSGTQRLIKTNSGFYVRLLAMERVHE